MIVVGLTGSLASGKSAAAKAFKKFGATVFDADDAARRAVEKGKPAHRAIGKLFGKRFFTAQGQLDRPKLAKHVFTHPADLKKLNILVHPAVIVECLGVIDRMKKKKGILVLDVPLLFESKMDNLADYTVVVRAPRETLVERAKKRGIDGGLAERILSTQWSMAKKARLADFVLDNDGSPRDLEKQVSEVLEKIKQEN